MNEKPPSNDGNSPLKDKLNRLRILGKRTASASAKMLRKEKPSEIYRSALANDLKGARTTEGRNAAMRKLSEERRGALYPLAEALHREPDKSGPSHSKSSRDEFSAWNNKDPWWGVSNEPALFHVFPYIKHCKGVGIGVGFDQMLDIAVNSELSKVILLDRSTEMSLSMRAVLEVGRRHLKLMGTYPSREELVAYFEKDRMQMTLEMIRSDFGWKEARLLQKASVKEDTGGLNFDRIHRYFDLKANKTDWSWTSKPEHVKKIIDMYAAGNIEVVNADLAGDKAMAAIREDIASKGEEVSLVYVSNVTDWMEGKVLGGFTRNLELLAANDDAVVIGTDFNSGDFESIELPKYAEGADLGFMLWSISVRSMRDRRYDGSVHARLRALIQNKSPNTGLVRPIPGLVVSEDIAKRSEMS